MHSHAQRWNEGKKILITVLIITSISLTACFNSGDKKQVLVPDKDNFVTTTIIGSAEYPDPVLTKIRAFEKIGAVKNVRIMESYPAQIQITTKPEILDILEKIYRKRLSIPK